MSLRLLSDANVRNRPVVETLESRQLLANVATGFTDSTFVEGLARPTAMSFAPDGRIFVSLQDGKVVVVKNGQVLPTPALKIDVSKAGERGVQSTAFDPNFEQNGYIYLYYTALTPARNRLSRFTVSGDTINPASEKVLIEFEPLSASYHNGGALHFGKDGKLYVSVGDNVRGGVSQSMTSLFGKILRINPDGSIPTDNPYYNTNTGIYRAIYNLGFRNPFTFAIEPGTNRLFIADVGDNKYEELNRDDGNGGNNFGWPNFEGPSNDPRFVSPLFSYQHQPGCAIVGVTIYPKTGGSFPSAFAGSVMFADHCSGEIIAINPNTGAQIGKVATGKITANADLDIGPDGALYYLERSFNTFGGRIGRIQFNNAGTTAPTITVQPKDVKVGAGSPATLSVGVTGTPPFQYQWQKNGKDIEGATESTYTIPETAAADAGQYRVVIKNSKGTVTSTAATLTVTVNQAPVVTFRLPKTTTSYRAGDTITYSATATDPQDGELFGNNFEWQIEFHHDEHTHPFLAPTTGARLGTVVIPRTGEVSSNTWYEIILTVTDNDGNSTTVRRNIYPKKSKVSLVTNVPGLTLKLDDIPQDAPIGFKGVEKFFRTIEAPASQTIDGKTYFFQGWSDGGAMKHTISTPVKDTVYTATYTLEGAAGTGVIADYYNNIDFSGTHIRQIDPVINNKWEDGSPHPDISRDTFSARWQGLVKAQENATYTFSTLVDDSVRLWIGRQLIIDEYGLSGKENEYSGQITLKKGKNYELRMDFRESKGHARAHLYWETANMPKEVVPQTALFPIIAAPPAPTVGTVSASADAYVQNGSSADTSFGTSTQMHVKQATTPGLLRMGYLKFNLKNFQEINSAKLRLFGSLSDGTATNVATEIFGSSDTMWDETITFNNAPAISGGPIASTLIQDNKVKYYEWDITSYVKEQKALGNNVITLVVKNPAFSSTYTTFNTREAGANRPQIIVE